MKLAHIVPSLAIEHGGPSQSVGALCTALAHQGHEVDLLTTAPRAAGALAPARSASGAAIRTFPRTWPQRLCPSACMHSALQAATPKIVHHHGLWLRTLHYAHARARRGDARLVISPRGMMSDWAWSHHGGRKRLARWLIHPGALAATDGWHATSVAEEQEIRRRGFRQPVCVAPNGVTAPTETEQAEARSHWHSAYPPLRDARVALFYSRFHRKKRVTELIDLWVQSAPRDWLLLVVGIPEDFSLAELEAQVRAHAGEGRVAVFSGVGRPAPYAAASLFLLPSHNENFGLVIAEAMAHGLPVAVTDTTPWAEVQRLGHGWCVPWSEFPDAVRAATDESPEALARRGAAARDWVLREYSWQRSAQLLTAFYRDLKPFRG